MEYKRTIQFRYFRVFCKEKDNDNKWGPLKIYDLVKWLAKIDADQKLKKSIKFTCCAR